MKICGRCKQPRELSDFSKDNTRKDRLHSRCRPCQATYYREHIALNPRTRTPASAPVAQPKPIPLPDKLESFKHQVAAPFPDHLIQRIPTPPPRFQVELPQHGFSALGIGRYYP